MPTLTMRSKTRPASGVNCSACGRMAQSAVKRFPSTVRPPRMYASPSRQHRRSEEFFLRDIPADCDAEDGLPLSDEEGLPMPFKGTGYPVGAPKIGNQK